MASFNKQHAAVSRKKVLFVSAGIADPRAGWIIPFSVAACAGEDDDFLPKGMNGSAQNCTGVELDQKSRYASKMMQCLKSRTLPGSCAIPRKPYLCRRGRGRQGRIARA